MLITIHVCKFRIGSDFLRKSSTIELTLYSLSCKLKIERELSIYYKRNLAVSGHGVQEFDVHCIGNYMYVALAYSEDEEFSKYVSVRCIS